MKKLVLLLVIFVTFFSCDEDSAHENLNEDKIERNKYLKEHNISSYWKTSSGLYCIPMFQNSKGYKPKMGDKVCVFYSFYYLDGEVIYSNCLDGYFEPKNYILGETDVYGRLTLMPSLHEALMKMKKGDKYRLVIPPSLSQGAPHINVEIYRTIICDLELKDIREQTNPDLEFKNL